MCRHCCIKSQLKTRKKRKFLNRKPVRSGYSVKMTNKHN
nr:MAG TPA: hypothetical protein [Bacteriophage sp.]